MKAAPKAAKPRGRPSKRTLNVEQQVLSRLSKGEPLTVICDDLGVDDTTVRRWSNSDEAFSHDIAHARVRGYDALAAECLLIANTTVEGIETTTKADGSIEEKRGDMLGHRKLQIETRLKLLAKWDPKRYGDLVKLSGADGVSPAVQALTVSFVAPGQEAK